MMSPPHVDTRRATLAQSRPLFLGMDLHTDAIAVADVPPEHGAHGPDLGAMGTRQWALAPMSRTRPSQATPLIDSSAAGPWGAWLSRSLTPPGDDGWGVAPALRPTTAGERVTTHRRDAVPLARLARAGALPLVAGPHVAAAASHALTRAPADPRSARTEAQGRRTACVRRQALRSAGRAHGGPAHRRWRSAVVWPTAAPPIVWPAYVRAIPDSTARRQRLAQARPAQVHAWRLPPVVEALQALRGGHCTVAVTRLAARGDLTRCEHPRALMPCLGLMPSESAPGAHRRQGARTKAGHTQARRALLAGAWAYREPTTGRRHLPRRLANQPQVIQAIRWQAQGRLWRRSRRLGARGKHAHVVTVAIARELAGFLWAIAKQVPVTP